MAVVSHNGILAAVSDSPESVGKHLQHWMVDDWQQDVELIRAGGGKIDLKGESIEIIVPLKIGRTETPWAVSIEVPEEAVLAKVQEMIAELKTRGKQELGRQIGVGLGITLLALLVIWFISKSIVTPITKSIDFAKAVAKGDLTATVIVNQKDEVGILANALINMRDRIRDVLNETKGLIQAVQEGRLDSRGNAEAYAGGWRELVTGINDVIDAFVAPISMTAEYIERLSKGDIPERVDERNRKPLDYGEQAVGIPQTPPATGAGVRKTRKKKSKVSEQDQGNARKTTSAEYFIDMKQSEKEGDNLDDGFERY